MFLWLFVLHLCHYLYVFVLLCVYFYYRWWFVGVSRSLRVEDGLDGQIAALAVLESRSWGAMVQVLVREALEGRELGGVRVSAASVAALNELGGTPVVADQPFGYSIPVVLPAVEEFVPVPLRNSGTPVPSPASPAVNKTTGEVLGRSAEAFVAGTPGAMPKPASGDLSVSSKPTPVPFVVQNLPSGDLSQSSKPERESFRFTSPLPADPSFRGPVPRPSEKKK